MEPPKVCFFEAGIGAKVMFKQSKAMFLAVTYKMQESDIKFSDETNQIPDLTTNKALKVQYQFVGIRVGLIF